MKLKLTPSYILSFLCLNWLVMELHEWAHTVVAALVSGHWGPRAFDHWEYGSSLPIANGMQAMAMLVGPLVNFLVLWRGWKRLANMESLADQSLGCSLVLAAMPMGLLIAAFSGGGDVTVGLKLLFSHIDGIYHHVMAGIGLVIILVATVPPIVRTFMVLPSWGARFIFFPIFLFAPIWLHHLVMHALNQLMSHFEADQSMNYAWVVVWTAALICGWLFTRRRLEGLLVDRELPL